MTACRDPSPSRRRRLIGIVLTLLAAGLAAFLWWHTRPSVPPELPYDDLDRDVAQAIQEAREAVLAHPRSAEEWGTLGRTLLANQVYTEAGLQCFLEAERLDVANPRWPYLSAGLLRSQGKSDQAIAKLESALARSVSDDEFHAAARMALAETLAAAGKWQVADEHFQESLRADPGAVRAHFGLGMLASVRGEWQACRKHLEACLGSRQAGKKAAVQLASVCERLGDSTAAKLFAELADRLPKDFDWNDPFVLEHAHLVKQKRERFRIVEQLEAEGRLQLAANLLAKDLTDDPDDDASHLMMGRLLAQLGQFPRAEMHLRRAIQLAPAKTQVRYLLSLTLFQHGQALASRGADHLPQARDFSERAIAEARTVIAARPENGHAYMALGLALQFLDRQPEALAAFQEAVHRNPEFAENHLHLGIALANAGRRDEARASLEQAQLLARPGDPRPREALEKHFPKMP